jgi:hypothetical protein
MGALVDVSGQTFGRLTVVRKVPPPEPKPGRKPRTEAFWECLCTCGRLRVVSTDNLRSGNTMSCGCLHREQLAERNKERLTRNPWEVDMAIYLRKLRCRAQRNGLGSNQFCQIPSKSPKSKTAMLADSWALSLEDYKHLVTGVCFYCGKVPLQRVQGVAGEQLLRNGIDRIDSLKGYTLDNCVTCCINCNREKRSQSLEEFVESTRRKYEWMAKTGLLNPRNL